jgi:hypothetical protein
MYRENAMPCMQFKYAAVYVKFMTYICVITRKKTFLRCMLQNAKTII